MRTRILILTLATSLLNVPPLAVAAGDAKDRKCGSWFQELGQFAKRVLKRKDPPQEEEKLSRILEPLTSEALFSPSWRGDAQPLASRATRATELFDLGTAVKNRQISQLKPSELTETRELDRMKEAPGLGFLKVLKAKYQGREVFVKVSRVEVGQFKAFLRTYGHFENEVAWTRRLEDLGVGPKLHGVSNIDGQHAIITEYIHGVHLDGLKSDIPSDFKPTENLIKSLKEIREVIHREGINAHDLQLRVTPDRAYVIDPEFFSPAQGEEMFRQADRDIEFYIQEFEKRLKN